MVEENELLSKSIELVSKAQEEGIPIRLIGGLAVAYLAPNGRTLKELHRESNDMDFFSLSSHAGKLRKFFARNDLDADERFNALYGAGRQQYFYGQTKVDMLLDEFRMCHRIPLKGRLSMASITIPPSDLLLTKLQIYELNEKDIKDCLALMHDLKMGNSDTHTSIDAGYIADLLSADWGLYRTVTMNLERLNSYLESSSLELKKKRRISEEIEYLRNAIVLRPKSVAWKLRARIGDKVKWYELPEEVEYVIPKTKEKGPKREPAELVFQENGRAYQWLSFTEMQHLTGKIADEVMEKYGKPKAILYIERGGMVIAEMLAERLKIGQIYGLQMVAYEDVNRIGSKIYVLPHYIDLEVSDRDYVLLVDDIADSGKTMKAATELFKKKYRNVVTATMAYKPRSVFKPDIIGKKVEDTTWIVFDYEENESLVSFRNMNIKSGMKLVDRVQKERQEEFDEIKGNAREIAAQVAKASVKPAAILYMTGSGLVLARLLSDYLSVKRVSSVMPNKYITGDYMLHVANVCKKALTDSTSNDILLVDRHPEGVQEIKRKLQERVPDAKIYTAATERSRSAKADFMPR